MDAESRERVAASAGGRRAAERRDRLPVTGKERDVTCSGLPS